MEHINHFPEEYDSDPHFTIDPDTRVLQYDSTEKLTIIQGDHNSEIFTFDLPRYVDGHDMTQCDLVRVHYINVDSNNNSNRSPGVYNVKDLQVSQDDENIVVCSWAVSKKATKYAGTLSFLVQFACTDGKKITYSWHTSVYNDVIITKGMDNAETESETYTDILHDWYLELLGEGQSSLMSVVNARDEAISNIKNATEEAVLEFIAKTSRYGGVEVSTEQPISELTILWFNPDESTLSIRNSETGEFEPLNVLQGDLNYIADELGESTNLTISQKEITRYINALVMDNGAINADILGIKERLNDIKTFSDKVEVYKNHVLDLEKDIVNHAVDVRNKFDTFTRDINSRVVGMEDIRDDLNRDINHVKATISTFLDAPIPTSVMLSRLSNLEDTYVNMSTYNDFYDDFCLKNTSINETFHDHNERITSLESLATANDVRSVKNESDIVALTARIATAETYFNDSGIDYNELYTLARNNKATIESFFGYFGDTDARVTRALDSIENYSDRLSVVETQVSSCDSDLSLLNAKYIAIEGLIKSTSLDKYNDRLVEVEREYNQLRNDLNAVYQMVQSYHPAQ